MDEQEDTKNAATALDGTLFHKRPKRDGEDAGSADSLPEDMTEVPDSRNIAASRDWVPRGKDKK